MESSNDTPVFLYSLSAILIAFSVVARILFYPIVTSDYSSFLANWFTVLQTQGIHAFAQPFSDYAPLYLYFLNLLSSIPLSSLYAIKSLSVLFDIFTAFFVYRIIRDTSLWQRNGYALFATALTFAVPTLLINSSLWGQSDAVYAAGVVASFYFIVVRRPILAVIAFALALCVKLQAIFFFPILLGVLIREREVLWSILLIPFVFFLSLVPAILGGGSLSYWGLIYLKQSTEYPWLSVSAPSIYAYITNVPLGSWSTVLFYLGIAVALVITILVIIHIVRRPELTPRWLVALTFLSVLALPYFLPRMHERYFYLADIFSVLYALFFPRRWYAPVLMVGASFMAYMPFLSGQVSFLKPFYVNLTVPATILAALLLLSIWWFYGTSRTRA